MPNVLILAAVYVVGVVIMAGLAYARAGMRGAWSVRSRVRTVKRVEEQRGFDVISR